MAETGQRRSTVNADLFHGNLVYLAMESPEDWAKSFSRWRRDTEYFRLLDTMAVSLSSVKAFQKDFEANLEKKPFDDYLFSIRTLEDNCMIGFIWLGEIEWNHGNGWVGIGLGEREFWGKGYGTDAMRVILRYAFTELNLHRVSLDVFEYNPRAIKSYEKAGFTVEGQMRRMLRRDGRRWDMIFMGILKEEWERLDR
jgi:RimJ/RimL family protein N-acetyltransferase